MDKLKSKEKIAIGILVALSLMCIYRLFSIGMGVISIYILAFDVVVIATGAIIKEKGAGAVFSKEVVATVLMLIPIVISTQEIITTTEKHLLWRHWTESTSHSIAPNFISTLFAVTAIFAVVVRNNPKQLLEKKSVYAFIIVDVLFVASFLSIFCGGEPFNIPVLNISSQALLVVAILFSWFCIRQVSGFLWIGIAALGVLRLTEINAGLGFTGAMYVLAAFLSLILQWRVLDFRISLAEFKQEFLASARQQVLADVTASTQVVSGMLKAQSPQAVTSSTKPLLGSEAKGSESIHTPQQR